MLDWRKEYINYIDLGEGPFYTDYLNEVQKSYPNIGLASTDWGNEEDYPNLHAHKDEIITHFNEIYKYREIGAETESRFQYNVDRTFDDIKRKYEYFFSLYGSEDITVIGQNRVGSIETTYENTSESTNNSSTSNSAESKNVFKDTPIQPIFEGHDYATNITDSKNDTTGENDSRGTNSNSGNSKVEHVVNDRKKSNIELINENVDSFRDLIDMFVSEFKICFINEIARI